MHLAKQPFADFITEQKRHIPRDYHRAGLRIGRLAALDLEDGDRLGASELKSCSNP
jgi:hypothetical protein